MSNPQPSEESFRKDVAKHQMQVLLDDGVHRCLRFRQPGSSNMWFDVVTWPGFLAYAGDMGSFVFTRLNDMFQFFRADPEKGLRINPDYWAEKLEAVDRNGRRGGYSQFSADLLRKRVEERIADWLAEYEGEYDSDEEEMAAQRQAMEKELREAVEEEVYSCFDEGEQAARKAVSDFGKGFAGGQSFQFTDSWEWHCEEYTYRFLWCCYALVWAIQIYDVYAEVKAAAPEAFAPERTEHATAAE